MSNWTPEMINSAFIQTLDSPTLVKKAASEMAGYIRDRLRDVQFSRRVIPAQAKSPQDKGIQRSVNHDGFVFMDEIEPDSSAMALAWTGMAQVQYLKAKRYEVPFFRINSKEFQITEQELWASNAPIQKIVDDNTVKDVGTIEDYQWLLLVNQAIAATGQVIKGTAVNAGVASADIILDDLVNLQNILTEQERPAEILLINTTDYNKLLKWGAEDVGESAKTKLVYGGYMPETIQNLRVVRTLKTSLLTQGNIYVFSPPEFVGRFFTMGTTKFEVKKDADLIRWQSWEFLAMSIANAWSIAKLELYAGPSQALTTNTEDLFASNIAVPPVAYPTIISH